MPAKDTLSARSFARLSASIQSREETQELATAQCGKIERDFEK
jgi:hypothetical protein